MALFFWIIAQVTFGTLLANNGKLEVAGTKLLDLSGKVSSDELYEYHSLSGTVLLGFGVWLFFLKLYIVFGNVPRAKINNGLVEQSIRGHFFFTFLLFLVQFFTHGNGGELVVASLGVPKATLSQVHVISAYMILGNTILLTCEKFYLLSSAPKVTEGAKRPSPKLKKDQ